MGFCLELTTTHRPLVGQILKNKLKQDCSVSFIAEPNDVKPKWQIIFHEGIIPYVKPKWEIIVQEGIIP